MKITRIDSLHANGGGKPYSFLKISTDEGLVGWSEYSEYIGTQGLGAIIERLGQPLIGTDPRETGRIATSLYGRTRVTAGGINAQASAALENACLDIKGKALGVPVSDLFGGAVRDRVRVYWSHCGTYRARAAEQLEKPPLRTLDDVKALGAEAARRGFKGLKTNLMFFDGPEPRGYSPGFGFGPGHPELDLDARTLDAIVQQMAAFREGAGRDMALMMDLNFNFKPAGLKRIARALEPVGMNWLEMDLHDAESLAHVRRSTATPIGSMEAVYHRVNALPFFQHRAVDVAIIDVMWNGMSEAVRIAALADTFHVNINSHCFSSSLGLVMGAQLCAVAPNFHFAEMDVDQVPWNDALFKQRLTVENGELVLPQRPGWGLDVDEEAIAAHRPSDEDMRKWFLVRNAEPPRAGR